VTSKSTIWFSATVPCVARTGPSSAGRVAYVTTFSCQVPFEMRRTRPPLLLFALEPASTWTRRTARVTGVVPMPLTTKRR
jgi:hypothetical protein